MKDGAPREWWRTAFSRRYLACYAHRDDAAADREAEFVARILALACGDRVLDAGCGAGRHARALARRGARVVGVDASMDLLGEAQRAAGGPRYALGDLRRLPLRDGAFAHAVSLFTSFGYFDEAGDRTQLAELRRVLRPGGGFVLDFLNAPRVEATLVEESQREGGGRVVRESRRIRGGRVEKAVELRDAEGVTSWVESVRLYGRDELRAICGGAGFAVRAEFGDLAGGAWTPLSSRLVLVAAAA